MRKRRRSARRSARSSTSASSARSVARHAAPLARRIRAVSTADRGTSRRGWRAGERAAIRKATARARGPDVVGRSGAAGELREHVHGRRPPQRAVAGDRALVDESHETEERRAAPSPIAGSPRRRLASAPGPKAGSATLRAIRSRRARSPPATCVAGDSDAGVGAVEMFLLRVGWKCERDPLAELARERGLRTGVARSGRACDSGASPPDGAAAAARASTARPRSQRARSPRLGCGLPSLGVIDVPQLRVQVEMQAAPFSVVEPS